jgi:hypothetical protein
LSVTTPPGHSAVERAAVVANRHRPFGAAGQHRVIVGPTDSLGKALVAASLSSRLDAALLLTPADVHPATMNWLVRRPPTGGYLVATPENVPYPTQWRYTTHVLPGDPAPSRADAPRGLLDLGRLGG